MDSVGAVSSQRSAISPDTKREFGLKDFRDLKVWNKAYALSVAVYKATNGFPQSERYGLTSPLRRSSVSVPTNIAEGCGRSGDADFARFLHIAMGSASELECLLLLANELGYLENAKHNPLAEDVVQVKQMLVAFIRKLKADC